MIGYLFGTGLVKTVQTTMDSVVMDKLSRVIQYVDGLPLVALVLLTVAARRYYGKRYRVELMMDDVIREGLVLGASVFINQLIKWICGQPRPYDEDPAVYVMTGSGNGFPSGTVQMFTLLALQYLLLSHGTRAVVAVAALVSLTRMYLGLHYLHDCLGGAAIAVGIFAVLES